MEGPGELWAVIDARVGSSEEVTPTAVVGGIPLFVRLLRRSARLGFRGAAVQTTRGGEEEIRRLLRRYPVSQALLLEVGPDAGAPDGAPAIPLEGRGLYRPEELERAAAAGEAPSPDILVASRADVRRAERLLFARIRKSVALDGVIAYYVMRPASRVLTRLLLGTRVSPNAATLTSLACGLAGAAFAASGGHAGAAAAGLLYFLSGIVDCVDGELARLRLQGSKLGEWLDSAADELTTFSLLAGLGIGLARDGYGDAWAVVAAAGSLLGLATVGRLYYDLHRLRLPIDTAQYPWFFSGSGEQAGEARGALGTLLYGLGYLVRRDANVTGIALLCVLDLRRVAVGILVSVVALVFLLTVVHLVITSLRGGVGGGEGA